MKALKRFSVNAAAAVLLSGLAGCTAIGAGVGAVVGSGTTAGMVGGAVIGGVVGYQMGK